ncbi:MAG: hypothetical protein ABFD50_10600 [Smithella sp.]
MTINELTINKLRFMLDNDYKDFEVFVSDNTETVKIKSKVNPNLPVIVIGDIDK